ncbi:MAG: GNAT family N-acetyltransferase [Chlamydiae bacterium]|nr:GNAT family N-acetyltransferase [Chlamydiota bacterium]
MILKTKRLILRPWKKTDLDLFFKLNSDPKVMEFFPSILSKDESDKLAEKIQEEFTSKSYGLWAVQIPSIAEFIGFIGLNHPDFKASFTPCVEIGWRLAYPFWNKGYATEGAIAALKFGFEKLNLSEIVAFTYEKNMRSRHVMEKLKMTHDPKEDFNHPKLPSDHPLRLHVLYRLKQETFFKNFS